VRTDKEPRERVFFLGTGRSELHAP
jgi:hypothetical protein